MMNGKIHYKWSFSIAMLNYQRVIQMMSSALICFLFLAPLPEGQHTVWMAESTCPLSPLLPQMAAIIEIYETSARRLK